MNKQVILFGAGLIGRRALDYFGAEQVFCFADNNISGQEFRGKRIISLEELLEIADEYEIVITVSYRTISEVEEQLADAGINNAKKFENYIDMSKIPANPDIAKFNNIHKGKRCFLIGNGPSLDSRDLDTLLAHNEITIGCNLICKIYEQTKWRPDYLVLADARMLEIYFNEIAETECAEKFITRPVFTNESTEKHIRDTLNSGKGNCHFYYMRPYDRFDKIEFSENPSIYVSSYSTVMFIMLQYAAYMGFAEIYLLGVDATFKGSSPEDYVHNQNHFYTESDVETIGRLVKPVYLASNSTSALYTNSVYSCCEEYSRSHGFRIFNATRGGALEIFERVDFDSLF